MADVAVDLSLKNNVKQELEGVKNFARGWGDDVKGIFVGTFAAMSAQKLVEGIGAGFRQITSIIKSQVGEWISSYQEAAQVDAQLAASLKSTGRDAEFSAQRLSDYATELEHLSTFGDEAIKSTETLLLKFKSIKGDEFARATALAVDMAAKLGGEPVAAAEKLGMMLNNPARGMKLLAKEGMALNAAQAELVASMVAAGDQAGAQNILLEQMESAYAGSAAAAAAAAGGGIKQFKESIGDMQELLGAKILPILDTLAVSLKNHLEPVVADVAERFGDWKLDASAVDTFSSSIAGLVGKIGDLAIGLKDMMPVFESLVGTIQDALDLLPHGGRASAADTKFVKGLTQEDFDAKMKAITDAQHAGSFIERKGIVGAAGIDVSNQQDFDNFAKAMEARLDQMVKASQQRHELSGAARGEEGQMRDMLSGMLGFGGSTSVIKDDTKARAAQENQQAVQQFKEQMAQQAMGMFNVFGEAATGIGEMARDDVKGVKEKAEKPPKAKDEEKAAAGKVEIEDAASMFRRIQLSAASPEQRTAKESLEENKKAAKHLEKIATTGIAVSMTGGFGAFGLVPVLGQ